MSIDKWAAKKAATPGGSLALATGRGMADHEGAKSAIMTADFWAKSKERVYPASAKDAKAATDHANIEGTSSKAHAAAAQAHRLAASNAPDEKTKKQHEAKAAEHQSLSDEYSRDEKGRFAKK